MGIKSRLKRQEKSNLSYDEIVNRNIITEIAFKRYIGLKCMLGYFIVIIVLTPLMYLDFRKSFDASFYYIYALWLFPFIPMIFSYSYYEIKIRKSYYADKRDLLESELQERLSSPENKKASGISKKIVFIIVCIFLSVLISKLVRLYR